MHPQADTYLNNETYAALRSELQRLITLPHVHDPDTEIVRLLGEVGGIWPESVLDDAIEEIR